MSLLAWIEIHHLPTKESFFTVREMFNNFSEVNEHFKTLDQTIKNFKSNCDGLVLAIEKNGLVRFPAKVFQESLLKLYVMEKNV